MNERNDLVVVWGNCQAEPLAALLAPTLERSGLRVVPVPAVHLVDEAGIARVHELVARAALLISQPIGDDYRWPGSSTAALAERLPVAGRLLMLPVAFHVGAFPFQVNAHGGAGERVDAPLTDYHDLRMICAAARGLSVAQTLRWWPAPDRRAVLDVAARSRQELQRREAAVDVVASDLLDEPDAMWTMTHPTNRVLGEIAGRILVALGVDGDVTTPDREFLGERRAPLEAAVAVAHGWPASTVRTRWQVGGRAISDAALASAQLAFYAARPDVVADSLERHCSRLAQLGLARVRV